MAKVTPKRNFLLRHEGGKDTIAKKGVKIDVSDDEHRKFFSYFVEPAPKKKS